MLGYKFHGQIIPCKHEMQTFRKQWLYIPVSISSVLVNYSLSKSSQIFFIHKTNINSRYLHSSSTIMSSLGSTDLAGLTTDDKNLYLFYQRSGYIVEAFSEEGGPPTQTSVQVAADAQSGGSPLTAYFVKEDMNYDKHSTV